MKMHHTQIEMTNPFAEAANGGQGMPGQGGVTGGGEAHEAWNQAVQQADLDAGTASDVDKASALAGDQMSQSSAGMGDQLRTEEVSVSWDRLSMTVASMVAWNMQVEMAEETPAGELPVGSELLDIAPIAVEGLLSTGDEQIAPDAADAVLGAESALAMTMAADIAAVDENFDTSMNADLDPLPEMIADESLVQSVSNIEDGLITPELFDSSDIKNTVSKDAGQASALNTANAADEVSSVEMSTLNESIPEIPGFELTADVVTDAGTKGSQTPVMDVDMKASTASAGTVAQTIKPEVLATTSEPAIMSTEPIAAEGKSAVPAAQEIGAQNPSIDTGLERLEGIRSAIAELDAHVTVRAQVADPASSTNELKAKLAELEMTYRVSREVLQSKSQQSQQPTMTTQLSDQNLVQKNAQPNVDNAAIESEEQIAEPIGKSARPVRERASNALASGIHRPGGTGEGSGAGLETGGQIPADSPTASFAGNENTEISADMDRNIESLEFDAANIEAAEVPELPVQDMSQIDVDFEDPSGHVRLGLGREGQEVSVQLETPEDALQDYKDMEEEMAEQLAKQGLDLASFTADSNSDGGSEEADSNSPLKESRQGALSDADKGESLEQAGTSARLVNRIV